MRHLFQTGDFGGWTSARPNPSIGAVWAGNGTRCNNLVRSLRPGIPPGNPPVRSRVMAMSASHASRLGTCRPATVANARNRTVFHRFHAKIAGRASTARACGSSLASGMLTTSSGCRNAAGTVGSAIHKSISYWKRDERQWMQRRENAFTARSSKFSPMISLTSPYGGGKT